MTCATRSMACASRLLNAAEEEKQLVEKLLEILGAPFGNDAPPVSLSRFRVDVADPVAGQRHVGLR